MSARDPRFARDSRFVRDSRFARDPRFARTTSFLLGCFLAALYPCRYTLAPLSTYGATRLQRLRLVYHKSCPMCLYLLYPTFTPTIVYLILPLEACGVQIAL